MTHTTTAGGAQSSAVLPKLLRMHNRVQHYAWGDTRFIPTLLNIDNADGRPFAELWMGAHPDLPSEVELEGKRVPLDKLIGQSPGEILGADAARRFDGRLPYLFKVLSAAAPLSIQVHPSKQSAEEGFAREEAAGIPLSAPNRNYRDRNHKPELIVALTEFYALRGFRPLDEIADVLREIPELADVAGGFEPTPESLKATYKSWMTLPQQQVDAVLDSYLQRIKEADRQQPYPKSAREYWVLCSDRQFSHGGHRDRGLLSILLLNLIRLEPSEALALSAGVLHAYLEGSGMELMANSNNVIRGGLTPKHVDVPELLRNVAFTGEPPQRLCATPSSQSAAVYETPFCEFELRKIDVSGDHSHQASAQQSAEIVFVAAQEQEGSVTIAAENESLELCKGQAALVRQGVDYQINARGKATLFRAGVPKA